MSIASDLIERTCTARCDYFIASDPTELEDEAHLLAVDEEDYMYSELKVYHFPDGSRIKVQGREVHDLT